MCYSNCRFGSWSERNHRFYVQYGPERMPTACVWMLHICEKFSHPTENDMEMQSKGELTLCSSIFRLFRKVTNSRGFLSSRINIKSQFDFQGSRKCRAKIITDNVNGQTAIVNVKGNHNHPVNIKREKRFAQMRRQNQPQSRQVLHISKVEQLDSEEQYQDFIIESDDDSIIVWVRRFHVVNGRYTI